ncbi:MAG: trypsin-like peptidase domain-containing protein [Chloroflexota bacterium]
MALSLVGITGCDILTTTSSETSETPAVITTGASSNPILPSFVEVVEKAKPSVVVIETNIGAGSGWIIDSNGIIVTNYHVIEDATDIHVILNDGRVFTAESVSSDSLTDIAIVYIDAQNLSAADISDCCELKVGQPVAAIGNALGQGISLKGGWISRLEVSITVDGRTLYGLIETDAAINEGNSGGPLINMAGEVIGITSVKLIDVGIEGVGYAINMDTALPVINELIATGFVVRPYLGVAGVTIDYVVIDVYDLEIDSGFLITLILPDLPAEQASLMEKDVISAIDDIEINSIEELVKAIRSQEVGQEIKITYWRGGSQHTTYATLVEMPE